MVTDHDAPGGAIVALAEVLALLARDDLAPAERAHLMDLRVDMRAPSPSPVMFEIGQPVPAEARMSPSAARAFRAARRVKRRVAGATSRATIATSAARPRERRASSASTPSRAGPDRDDDPPPGDAGPVRGSAYTRGTIPLFIGWR
ncbi:MAG: hypothetical protein V7607_3227 [Solirubrobacteraceae bacterium]